MSVAKSQSDGKIADLDAFFFQETLGERYPKVRQKLVWGHAKAPDILEKVKRGRAKLNKLQSVRRPTPGHDHLLRRLDTFGSLMTGFSHERAYPDRS